MLRTIAMHTTPLEKSIRLYLLCLVSPLASASSKYRWNVYTSWLTELVFRATRLHPSQLHASTWYDLSGKYDGKRHKLWYTSHTRHFENPKQMELLLLAM